MSGPINGDEPDSLRRTLFSFEGRVPRKTFWLWGVLALLLMAVVSTMLTVPVVSRLGRVPP